MTINIYGINKLKKFYGKLETFNEVLFITLVALIDASPC